MSSTQYLIPKDPPSYESLYQTIPSQSSHEQQQSQLAKITCALQRYIRRHSPFLQTMTAAIFVAATVSTTVMLLLWQLQNLASPQYPEDDSWFDLGEYAIF
ncbi:uncharacterized protein BX663DRAFT_562757 [Cokeromyces recurvatus]|uniref:uncharacterized protein n=1 Tax=Cokeromyces recurvatus TaxID=90255 RepID=UPI0022206E82|nr:uncharacterized protein BX663DRAFT_562757 [Cokeromyces recurvatus]KAI7901061.1 hypothetical protein BX663DRAFT_562757 [Cokeromyces recurvatus]